MRGGAGLSKAVVTAAGVVALGLVGGCSGGDEAPPGGSGTPGTPGAPSASTSSTSSTPTHSSPSTAAPEVQVPAAATKRTAAGAEAFARFYTEAMQDSMISGESKAIRVLSLDTCKACKNLADVIDTRAEKGQHQKRPTFTFGPSQMSSAATESTPVIDILVEDAGVEIVNASGATVSKSAAAKLNFRHTLSWNSGWRVAKSVLVK